MTIRFFKTAAVSALVLASASSFAAQEVANIALSAFPIPLELTGDANCKVQITKLTQDGRGQAIKVFYKNTNKVDREKFDIKVTVLQGTKTYAGGVAKIDNANPKETGNRGAEPTFAGNLKADGTKVTIKLNACSYPN